MSEAYLAEIKLVSFNFAPHGWALCNGQLLPINQNQALFSLLGTTYGGDGRVNFALPDFRGRTPLHLGGGHVLGERGGEVAHTLSTGEIPPHRHAMRASDATATLAAPGGAVLGDVRNATGVEMYAASADVAMNAGNVGNGGGGQPHANEQPFLVLNFVIALVGIFPSRN